MHIRFILFYCALSQARVPHNWMENEEWERYVQKPIVEKTNNPYLPPLRPSHANVIPAVDEAVLAEMGNRNLVGVGIGIAEFGDTAYLQGYGYQDMSINTPVMANITMFRWASIAKTITAVIALRLWERRLLDFDVDIQQYYPTSGWPSELYRNGTVLPLPDGSRTVTMRMLMAHLGGMPHYTNSLPPGPDPPLPVLNDPEQNQGIQWAIDNYLIGVPMIAVPGEAEYHYTTFGMNLAGGIEEKITGLPWADLMRNEVVVPARIPTLYVDNEFSPVPNRAVGYVVRDGQIVTQGSNDVSYKAPGGGLISTVEDLLIYGKAMAQNTLLRPASVELLHTKQPGGDYGIGFVIGERNGNGYISHGGTQQKTRTQLRIYNDGLTIAVMSNSQEADTVRLVNLIEDAYRTSKQ